MDSSTPQEQNKKYIFVDTCVIQAAGSNTKSKSDGVIKCLQGLNSEGFSLAISEITWYENLHGLWGKKALDAASILKTYEQKIVSNQVLVVASILGGLYHGDKLDGIDMGDKIIAATALLENGFVLTENHKDYPAPFFIQERYIPLTYLFKSYSKTMDLALYKPNTELINRRIGELEKQS
jgi:predicted nucleic acid-binding protein